MNSDFSSTSTQREATIGAIGWACVTEPGDQVAGEIVMALGPAAAWRWLTEESMFLEGTSESDARVREIFAQQPELLSRRIGRWRTRLPEVNPDEQLRHAELLGATVLVPGHPDWPLLLDDLGPLRPHCLWVRGSAQAVQSSQRGISMVGARATTTYGEYVTSTLLTELAPSGISVVSGGAFGIDAAAHRGALNNDLPTVAVLAGGVDRLYPTANAQLQRAIITSGGAVVSEMPPGSLPMRSRFLQRNRLIAALTPVTVVVEAAWRSGSLSTAHHALEVGREVGAVPGPLTSTQSAGCHKLLRETPATLITSGADVLALLGGAVEQQGQAGSPPERGATWDANNSRQSSLSQPEITDPRAGLNRAQLLVLDCLNSTRSCDADNICRSSGLLTAEVLPILGLLEMRGLAIADSGGWRLSRTAKMATKR